MIKGYTSDDKLTRDDLTVHPCSVTPLTGKYRAIDTRAWTSAASLGAATVAADTTARLLNSSAAFATALPGDIIRFTSGALSGLSVAILQIAATDSFILVADLPALPTLGDAFEVARYTPAKVETQGLASSAQYGFNAGSGLWVPISVDASGVTEITTPLGVPLPVQPGGLLSAAGSLDAVAETLSVAGQGPVVITLAGTYGSFNGTFESSTDNATWNTIPAFLTQTGAFSTTTGVISNQNRWYKLTIPSGTYVRIRCTAIVSGTVNVNIYTYPYFTDSVLGVYAAQSGTWSVSAVQSGAWTVFESPSSTNTAANVTVDTTGVTLLAADSGRRKFMMYNDSATTAYVKFGSTPSTTSFHFKLIQDQYFVSSLPVYTGIITAITAAGTATVRTGNEK